MQYNFSWKHVEWFNELFYGDGKYIHALKSVWFKELKVMPMWAGGKITKAGKYFCYTEGCLLVLVCAE